MTADEQRKLRTGLTADDRGPTAETATATALLSVRRLDIDGAVRRGDSHSGTGDVARAVQISGSFSETASGDHLLVRTEQTIKENVGTYARSCWSIRRNPFNPPL